jgi:hypothetical protein
MAFAAAREAFRLRRIDPQDRAQHWLNLKYTLQSKERGMNPRCAWDVGQLIRVRYCEIPAVSAAKTGGEER